MFTEMFGFSGFSKPVDTIMLNEPEADLTDYVELGEDIELSNDLMQKMVLATNREISKKTGLCTYIIETTAIKKFTNVKTAQEIYRCMFMAVKHSGFALGFAVTSDIRMDDGTATVLSVRSQPINVDSPVDPSIYQTNVEGKEFEDYSLVRQSEIYMIKNTELVEKVLSDPQTMYGKMNI
jgi:hypothetical protein